MKGTKEQRGITLIALIITIVVLLILAAVAISSITNDGILHYAQNAADSWNKAQTNEQATLDSYLAYLDNLKYQQCPGHTYSSETGLCTNCGYPCQHQYDFEICIVCQYKCKHDGERTDMEYIAMDENTHYGYNDCALCGFDEVDFGLENHAYGDDNLCDLCKYVYDCDSNGHVYGDDYVCDLCGGSYDCDSNGHVYGDDYVCDLCGGLYDCSTGDHKWNGDSVCDICGSECVEHQWDDDNLGVCLVCSYQCKHENSSAEWTYVGMEEQHSYEEWCNDCGWVSSGTWEACEYGDDNVCDKCSHERE